MICYDTGHHRSFSGEGAGILCHEQMGTGISVPHRTCNTVFNNTADHDVRSIYAYSEKK